MIRSMLNNALFRVEEIQNKEDERRKKERKKERRKDVTDLVK